MTECLYKPIFYSKHAICHFHLIYIYLIPLNIFGVQDNYQAPHNVFFFALFLIPLPEGKCS